VWDERGRVGDERECVWVERSCVTREYTLLFFSHFLRNVCERGEMRGNVCEMRGNDGG